MSDLTEFTVSDGTVTVFVCQSGPASFSLCCHAEGCRAGRVVGYEDWGHVARGAVGHLRWHASGCRFCVDCDITLGPDEPGDRCAPGTCPADESPVPAGQLSGSTREDGDRG